MCPGRFSIIRLRLRRMTDIQPENTQEPRRLEWGQTPFDELSREELQRQCQRLYAAAESLTSIVKMCQAGQEYNLFWTRGPGGRALEQGEQALEAARQDFHRGDIYDSFFRYACDLLFTPRKPHLRMGKEWVVCSQCAQMVGSLETNYSGRNCADVASWRPEGQAPCSGVLRPLEWSDLAPARASP